MSLQKHVRPMAGVLKQEDLERLIYTDVAGKDFSYENIKDDYTSIVKCRFPGSEKPVASKPATSKPVASKPVASKPVASKPATSPTPSAWSTSPKED